MNLEESLKSQIKDLNVFIKKQTKHFANNEKLIIDSIGKIEDVKIKTQLSAMLNLAKTGDINSVQAIFSQITNELKVKKDAN
jgi:hypothetical protein